MPPSAVQETILLVEDEILIRTVIAEYLRECGYKVLEGVTAANVMAVLGSGQKVDVVFSRFDLGRTDIIGVECKDYGTTLTMADVNKIYSDHDTLVRQNLLHQVLSNEV